MRPFGRGRSSRLGGTKGDLVIMSSLMSSSTEKERLRRLAIEADYVEPEAVIPKHPTTDVERPTSGQRIKTAISSLEGTLIEEWSATVYAFPRWQRAKPDDQHLSFLPAKIEVYHLAALRDRDGLEPGKVVAVDVMYHNQKPVKARVAFANDDDRRATWSNLPVTSLARVIREAA